MHAGYFAWESASCFLHKNVGCSVACCTGIYIQMKYNPDVVTLFKVLFDLISLKNIQKTATSYSKIVDNVNIHGTKYLIKFDVPPV